MGAEAVIFFDPKRGAEMQSRRKRGGALASKHRFIAAQMEAFLQGDLWLTLARHANAMADALAAGLKAAGCKPVWPVEANEIFVPLPAALDGKLKAAGASYYPWKTESLPGGLSIPRGATTTFRRNSTRSIRPHRCLGADAPARRAMHRSRRCRTCRAAHRRASRAARETTLWAGRGSCRSVGRAASSGSSGWASAPGPPAPSCNCWRRTS